MWVMLAFMWIPSEVIRLPGAGITSICQPSASSAGKNVGPLGRAASALKVIHFSRLCGVLLTPFSEALGTLTGRKMTSRDIQLRINSKTWSQGLWGKIWNIQQLRILMVTVASSSSSLSSLAHRARLPSQCLEELC